MSNRQWLKELATSEKRSWMTAVLPAHLDGLRRLETRHTVYVFEDAECTEVVRRGAPEEGESSMIGMRIVGWLLEVEGSRRLVDSWRPGARAILWRAPRVGERESKIALTSPSFGFVRCEPDDDDEWDLVTTEYEPLARPSLPPRPTATGAFTRAGSPLPPA